MALTFSDVKIEKLLSLPDSPIPNRFYLVETGGTVKFYLSDSKGILHLLNEGFVDDFNVNKIVDYGISVLDNHAVFHDFGAIKATTFYLPCIQDGMEISFFVVGDTIRIASSCSEQIYLGDSLVSADDLIESNYIGSFLCLRAVAGVWTTRYMTGQWNILPIDYIDGGSASSEFAQIIDGGNVLSEYTNIIDGGSP